jgi:hypothetical protein
MPFATGASGPQDVDRGRHEGADEQSKRGALPDEHGFQNTYRITHYGQGGGAARAAEESCHWRGQPALLMCRETRVMNRT